MGVYTPKVSVIVPTYNRSKILGLTIESFVYQDYQKDSYEIIISDNNSSDDTRKLVSDWQEKSDVKIGYVFEPRQGVHYARNSAAKAAHGEILYFTDDDMLADQKLLRTIVMPFSMGYNVGCAGGRIVPKWEVEPPRWITKYCYNALLSLNNNDAVLLVSDHDVGVYSCHQAIPREVFFKTGGFHPENTAGVWIGDGETGLNIRIKNLGYRFAFVGNSVIYHMIPESRLTQRYLNMRMANQGNCDSYTDYRRFRYDERALRRRIIAHFRGASKAIIAVIIRICLFNDKWRLSLARVWYFINRIKYDYRLITDEGWRKLVLKDDWLQS